jgi:putative ABC transport system permease protein
VRSLGKLLAIDPGFDARNVLTLRLTIPPGALQRDSMPGFYTQLIERLRAIPGVADVALNNCIPLARGCNGTRMRRLDDGSTDMSAATSVDVHWASPAWFDVMRVRLEQGRVFTNADRMGAPKVVLINESAARTLFPGENPIGKRVAVQQGGFDTGAEIVGVVGDIRKIVDSAAGPATYLPYHQSPRSGMIVFLRTKNDPAAVGPDVRRALREIAPRYAVSGIQPMTERAAAATAQARFHAILFAAFAATALSLALIGIYGVMSLAVAARTREIGIRIALGADRHLVQRLVIREGLALVSAGAVIGVAGALWSTRVLQNLLYDLKPSDPMTYAAILALLAAAALIASWIPARRASRVDPVVALRSE